MPRIFISYRRADSEVIAGRIYDRLEPEFGESNVFKDVDNIPVGQDFRAAVQSAINASRVMLVIIGRDWLDIRDSSGNRRLDNPADTVRFEIAAGLNRPDTIVVPVLVGGATMPGASDLPDELRQLAFQNAAVIRNDPDFRRDMLRLVEILKENDQEAVPTGRQARSRQTSVLTGVVAVVAFALIAAVLLLSNMIRLPGGATPTLDAVQEAQRLLTATRDAEIAALSSPTPNATELIGAVLTQFVVQTQAAVNQQQTLAAETQIAESQRQTLVARTPTASAFTPTPPIPTLTPTSIPATLQDDASIANAQATLGARATADVGSSSLPITVTLAVDTSGSMMVDDRIGQAANVLTQFVTSAPDNYLFSLLSFSGKVDQRLPFTDDRDALISALRGLQPEGDTLLYDGAYAAVELFASVQAQRRIVLLISDGEDTGSTHQRNEAIDLALQENVEIYTIGYGESIDITYLRELAEGTGGAFTSGDVFDITAFFEHLKNKNWAEILAGI